MDLLCSSIKVTLGGTVLVDWLHFMEFEPRLPRHDRNVQEVGALRASHKRTIGRGNITNQLQFSRVEKHDDHQKALHRALFWSNSIPAHAADCSIEIRGVNEPAATLYTLTLKDASVTSVPGRAAQMFSHHTITIVGGEMANVTGP